MPPATSSARAFWDYVNSQSDGFSYLCSLIDPNSADFPFFEQEWLEFKCQPRGDNDTKKIWSKALAGFANITDGLIIWGIDARKTSPRNIDAASGLRLIDDVEAFESKLREWLRDATNPPVTGVEYKRFPGPSGAGFVICLVPESKNKPHRAEWAEKQYYYRAGDDFFQAEPGLLRTLFFPQRSCQIEVASTLKYAITWSLSPGDPPSISAEFSTSLSVGGSSTGRDVYITFLSTPNVEMKIGTGQDWQYFPHASRRAFRAIRPLHPGETVDLFLGKAVKLKPGPVIGQQYWVLRWDAMEFEFEVYVADQERRVLRLLFEAETSVPGVREGSVTARAIPAD
jgi:hypothetical protein